MAEKQFEIKDHVGEPCRYCGKTVSDEASAAVTFAYWFHNPFICHKACKKEGERQEAFDSQVIDADCNDCRHYRRGKLLKGKNVFVGGTCGQTGKTVIAQPNFCSGHPCFEHRRALPAHS